MVGYHTYDNLFTQSNLQIIPGICDEQISYWEHLKFWAPLIKIPDGLTFELETELITGQGERTELALRVIINGAEIFPLRTFHYNDDKYIMDDPDDTHLSPLITHLNPNPARCWVANQLFQKYLGKKRARQIAARA